MPVKALSFSVLYGKMEKSKVRRCLFGKPDHDSLRKDLDEQLKATRTEMKSTWNFDSELDKPMDGRYEWTMVKQQDDVPSFYFKGYRPTKFRKVTPELSASSLSETCPSTPVVSRINELENVSDLDQQRENETTPEPRPSQRQSKIDEHFVKVKSVKRRLSCSSDDSELDDRPRKSPKVE